MTDSSELPADSTFSPAIFRISPLVRVALWSLYFALLLPMPFLVWLNPNLDFSIFWLCTAFVSGGVLLQMALSEQVHLNEQGISVRYPWWVLKQLRRGWSLEWHEIQDLKARSTGQGGLVYYLVSRQRNGFLLPMRIVGFQRMLRLIQAKTGIDMADVKPLAQPWMYAALLIAAVLLAATDVWILGAAWLQPMAA